MVEQPFKTKSALKQFVMDSATEITELMKSLTHPKRLQILALMSERSCDLSELLEKLDLQKSALANYLSVLVENNLVHDLPQILNGIANNFSIPSHEA